MDKLVAQPRLGVRKTLGANTIVEHDAVTLVSTAIPQGGEVALSRAVEDGWGVEVPEAPVSHFQDGVRLVRMAPDQLMVMVDEADAKPRVDEVLSGCAYTTDQTDAWIVLEISGPDTAAALERIVPLDLANVAEGHAARTVVEHLGTLILCLSPDRYLMLSASSSAESFYHAIETSYLNVML